jgi:hypothetical protein
MYEGTGMRHGDRIAGLIGWEWMGMPADIRGLEVVATGPTQNGAPPPQGEGTYAATVYPGPKNNFVFNAATCWWADGLAEPRVSDTCKAIVRTETMKGTRLDWGRPMLGAGNGRTFASESAAWHTVILVESVMVYTIASTAAL